MLSRVSARVFACYHMCLLEYLWLSRVSALVFACFHMRLLEYLRVITWVC